MIQLRLAACLVGLLFTIAQTVHADGLVLNVGYLRLEEPPRPVLSNLDPIPEDRGIAGAALGRSDNATTGQFLGHSYTMDVVSLPPDGDVVDAARTMLAASRVVILDMPAGALLQVADLPEAQGALLFNVTAQDARLRDGDCRANLLHARPELAMEADALMQVMLAKRWGKIALIEGPTPEDAALAQAYRTSARKFGLKIVSDKAWTFDTDLRRAAATEVPLFTQGFKKHDVILVADAHDDFARYIEHNTWEPRPVIGSTGLQALAWSPVVEQWGAAQLQSRFEDQSARRMWPRDYAAWAAMRSIGEAVTRTGQTTPDALRSYILSDAFELAAFQGRALSYRAWNGQLRQPIPVVNARAQVAAAPLDGFEHARNPLDSLGLDQPESACTAFGE
ncbi:ABC transporter substrate-binding protein [Pseudoprimorskyibacter insulae]|uniref:Leucine-binding protein domain-containing protein n=1 Tax=Pseudoprimorskyibacter insulae TaxID=1695997 RepID=A0A2R8B0C2_9RHOB|nr:ABC transporter substrate-binding protein [Pseudoprimorskyibacter insulae]SPF81700.1 hypothetical protein PRI8871_03525 [Pseudoprimorskyibacter insulae]